MVEQDLNPGCLAPGPMLLTNIADLQEACVRGFVPVVSGSLSHFGDNNHEQEVIIKDQLPSCRIHPPDMVLQEFKKTKGLV